MLHGEDVRYYLNRSLSQLRLPTVKACYEDQANRARKESLTYEQYLAELVELECEERLHRRIERFLKESNLPLEKDLNSFDMKRLPSKVVANVKALLDGSFLDRAENVLAFGNPGSGKTHLLCAIGQELVYKGRRVLFMPCSLLVQQLLLAKQNLRLPQVLKKLSKYDAIIIDDIGYVEQNREEMEVLFILLADRYERGSVMISSNLPFSKWDRIFKDPMTTAAAIDRVVHHSIILEMNLPSYRLEQSKNSKKH
jgi:DNA replication protein DnaC